MKKSEISLLLFFLLSLLMTSCKDKAIDCDLFQWSHVGDSGPEYWSTCYADCGGQKQSPVDISGAVPDNTLTPFSIAYEDVPIDLINKGYTLEFEYEPGSSLSFAGIQYDLLQFHFHTESEHTLYGQHYPLEVHLVHRNPTTGNYAVIGIFFETGNENPFLQHFINDLPDVKDETFSSVELVNVNELLPLDQRFYTYSGSLTTPPCSEIVTWIVLKNPIEISNSQLQKFVAILQSNSRPIQPLHGREIRESI